MSFAIVYCDTPFLTVVSYYTEPRDRGQLMGLFQIANSLGRMLSAWTTGLMQDYNIRDTLSLISIFGAASLVLLFFARPPIQRQQMDAAAQKQREANAIEAAI